MRESKAVLSDRERQEFNALNATDIEAMEDPKTLVKIAAYFREEGFATTADKAQQRLDELTGVKQQSSLAVDDAEIKKDMAAWEAEQKRRAQPVDMASRSNGAPADASYPPVRGMPAVRVRSGGQHEPQDAPKRLKQDSQVGGQLRSGKDYYTKRDKVADQQLMDLEEQEQDTGPVAATEGAAAAAAGIQELPEGAAERTQRLIEANADLPPLDRERMADFAKSRGNEYFKEKHYAAAVEEYTLSLGLRPGHAATHLNRAAAYIKLKRWEDADADTSNALVLDPGNLKALLRRGEARMQLGQHQQALQDYNAVLAMPAHTGSDAAKLASKGKASAEAALQRAQPSAGTRRMAIEETSDGEAEQQEAPEQHNQGPQQQQQPGVQASHGAAAAADTDMAASAAPAQAAAVAAPQPAPLPAAPAAAPTNVCAEPDAAAAEPAAPGTPPVAIGSHAAPFGRAPAMTAGPATPPPTTPAHAVATPTRSRLVTPAHQPSAVGSAAPVAAPSAAQPAGAAAAPPAAVPAASADALAADVSGHDSTDLDDAEPCVEPPKGPTYDEHVQELRLQGNAAFQAGRFQDSIQLYSQALKLAPDAASLYVNRAMARLKLQEWREAHGDASIAAALEPSSYKALHKRATAKQQLGDLQGAVSDFERCIQLAPAKNHGSLRQDVQAAKAALSDRQQAQRARADAAKGSNVHRYGSVLIEEHDGMDEAGDAQRVADELKADEMMHARRTHKLQQASASNKEQWEATRTAEWQEQCAAAQQAHTNAKAARQAEARAERAAAAAAAAAVQRQQAAAAVLVAPRPTPRAEQGPAGAVAVTGSAAGTATSLIADSAAQAPDSTPALSTATVAADAVTAPEQPSSPVARPLNIAEQAEQLRLQGNAHFKAKRFEDARLAFHECLQLVPEDAKVLANLAAVMLELGRPADAVRAADEALELDPGNIKAVYRRGLAHEKLGNLEAALQDLSHVKEALSHPSAATDSTHRSLNDDLVRVNAAFRQQLQQQQAQVQQVQQQQQQQAEQQQQQQPVISTRKQITITESSDSESEDDEAAAPACRGAELAPTSDRADAAVTPAAATSAAATTAAASAATTGAAASAAAQASERPPVVQRPASANTSLKKRMPVVVESSSSDEGEDDANANAASRAAHTQPPTATAGTAANAAIATSSGGSSKAAARAPATACAQEAPPAAAAGTAGAATSPAAQRKRIRSPTPQQATAAPAPQQASTSTSAAASQPARHTAPPPATTASTAAAADEARAAVQQRIRVLERAETQRQVEAMTKGPLAVADRSDDGDGVLKQLQRAMGQLSAAKDKAAAAAGRFREKGNEEYKRQRFAAALQQYNAAVEADELDPRNHTNRAQANLKLKRFQQANIDCIMAEELIRFPPSRGMDTSSPRPPLDVPLLLKTLQRRAVALKELGCLTDAAKVLREVLALAPGDKQALELDNEVKALKRQELQAVVERAKQAEARAAAAAAAAQGGGKGQVLVPGLGALRGKGHAQGGSGEELLREVKRTYKPNPQQQQQQQQRDAHGAATGAAPSPSAIPASAASAAMPAADAASVEQHHRLNIEEHSSDEEAADAGTPLIVGSLGAVAPASALARAASNRAAGRVSAAPSSVSSGPQQQQQQQAAGAQSKQNGAAPALAAALAATAAASKLPAPARSAVEFERTCASLFKQQQGGSLHAAVAYVKSLEPARYQAVFKSNLTPACLGHITTALQHSVAADPAHAEAALRALTKVDRFSMLVMLNPNKAAMRTVLGQLEAAGRDVSDLKAAYRA